MTFWGDVKWRAARVGAGRDSSLALLWMYSAVLLYAAFARLTGEYLYTFMFAVVVGEVFSVLVVNRLERAAKRPSFPAYTIGRITDAGDLSTLISRLEQAREHLKWYLRNRVGPDDFEDFILRSLAEEERFPASELPKTYNAMTQAIKRDLVDRAVGDGPPWRSIDREVRGLRRSLDGPDPDMAVRSALARLYMRARPLYRQRAASAKAGDEPVPAEPHRAWSYFVKYVLPPVVASVAAVLVERFL